MGVVGRRSGDRHDPSISGIDAKIYRDFRS